MIRFQLVFEQTAFVDDTYLHLRFIRLKHQRNHTSKNNNQKRREKGKNDERFLFYLGKKLSFSD